MIKGKGIAVLIHLLLVHGAGADEWDPVDSVGTNATSLLAPDQTLQLHGPHTLGALDTNDWFQINLMAGIPCQFSSSGSLNARGTLYADMDGTSQVAIGTQTGDFLFTYLPEISGIFYLKVQSWPLGSSDSYTLQYTILGGGDEWDPLDGNATNSTELSFGAAAQLHGPHTLDETDHYDWFCFNLSSGIVYRFESVGDSDTVGELYADPADLTWEMENDDGPSGLGANFQITYPSSVNGNFFLKVKAFSSGNASYDLRYYIPANDSDADQLLDSWEQQYFGDLTPLPNGQSDTDPFTNLEEYIAGTDPTNPASFFAVTNRAAGSVVLEWTSVAARDYTVRWAESLTNDFMQQGPTIQYPQNSYTDTLHNAASSGFYKVDVQLK